MYNYLRAYVRACAGKTLSLYTPSIDVYPTHILWLVIYGVINHTGTCWRSWNECRAG